jgi:hypothetical protein
MSPFHSLCGYVTGLKRRRFREMEMAGRDSRKVAWQAHDFAVAVQVFCGACTSFGADHNESAFLLLLSACHKRETSRELLLPRMGDTGTHR